MLPTAENDNKQSVKGQLELARLELLDLTTRNRLLHMPQGPRVKSIEVVDEDPGRVWRLLVVDKKRLSFVPQLEVVQSLLSGLSETGTSRTETELQTNLSPDQLDSRLLTLYYDAQRFEDEQGVNTLYLALGFLEWRESRDSDVVRSAPLVLVPVTLERRQAGGRFYLTFLESDLETNISLQVKLKEDFRVSLPDLHEIEDLDINKYFQAVEDAIENEPCCIRVTNRIVLGLFSFLKMRMYLDLNPGNWPSESILSHPLIWLLLGDPIPQPELLPETTRVDDLLDPRDMKHVLDADSSQVLAIEDARRGRNFVIQGPPGTGKSQTIVNMIAAAVADGKTVLFVAEKAAALEVVKTRLDQIGLGDLCLELHSHRARRADVLKSIQDTLELPLFHEASQEASIDDLRRHVRELNGYVELLHSPATAARGLSPYAVLSELIRLRERGLYPQDVELDEAREWDGERYRDAQQRVKSLADHVARAGVPAAHPWRGVGLSSMSPHELTQIEESVKHVLEALTCSWSTLSAVADDLGVSIECWQEARYLLSLASIVATTPTLDRKSILNAIWRDERELVAKIVDKGCLLSEAKARLDGLVTSDAWTADWHDVRLVLEARGKSVFRCFDGSYRAARAKLVQCWMGRRSRRVMLEVVKLLESAQEAREFIQDHGLQGQQAFGVLWQGEASTWDTLRAVDVWESESRRVDQPWDFRAATARIGSPKELASRLDSLRADLESIQQAITQLFQRVQLDPNLALGHSRWEDASETVLRELLDGWVKERDRIYEWLQWSSLAQDCRDVGLAALVDRLYAGQIRSQDALDTFSAIYHAALSREIYEKHPELVLFDSEAQESKITRFCRLDMDRMVLAREEVVAAHRSRIPRGSANLGEMGILHREFNKKRRHLSLRKVMLSAGRAIQLIKPVFLMSPLSVAQYLQPGEVEFDLLIVDEASQVRPGDALGAIARCKQMVIVGDRQQLPPTTFFEQLLKGESLAEEEQSVGDIDSILTLCESQRLPSRMLHWHYRSRHESLVAFSNSWYYAGKLRVPPSCGRTNRSEGERSNRSECDLSNGLGLQFCFVEQGIYDRGRSATNRAEAKRVADAVIEHMRKCPDLSLGVGTFSTNQRDVILDEIEDRRRRNPDLEPLFARSKAEPFFVKNLEMIQGDERDVIFISVGYGRDESGRMAMTFGPLAQVGGHRRLNVLVTRAKHRFVVFSSLHYDEIDTTRAKSEGVKALREFLYFAEKGEFSERASMGVPSGRLPQSFFEEQVAATIRALGYSVDYQVASDGFYIDLAIPDPDNPERYLLGIECDGASYHSKLSARDRDRIRQAVLEDRGWRIHRVWSTEWFLRPQRQVERLKAAISEAKAHAGRPSMPRPQDVGALKNKRRRRVIPAPSSQGAVSEPYKEADFTVSSVRAPHQDLSNLVTVVGRIVDIEGPVHRDEVARRVAKVWGLGRAGARVQSATNDVIDRLVRDGRIIDNDGFVQTARSKARRVRDRSRVVSQTLRQPAMLPPSEIQLALGILVQDHVGVPPEDAIRETAHALGISRVAADLYAVIDSQIEAMVRKGQLVRRDGKLYARGP